MPVAARAGERARRKTAVAPVGYAQLLKTIADPTDEEHESTMEWLGGSFDPEAFSPSQVRFWNPKRRWKMAFEDER